MTIAMHRTVANSALESAGTVSGEGTPVRPPKTAAEPALLWVLAAVILTYGLFLRGWGLSDIGYYTDELFHAVSAEHLATVGHQAWPSGEEYTRALPYTQLVSASFKWLGVGEGMARLPSVAFNVIFILISFLYVRHQFGLTSAVIYLLIISCAPMELVYARQCRMYSPFQLLHFLASIAFWHGIEGVSFRGGFAGAVPNSGRRVHVIPLVCCCAFAGMGFVLHDLAASLVAPIGLYITVRFGQSAVAHGFRHALCTRFGIALAAGLLLGGMLCIFRWNLVTELIRAAFWVPAWARHSSFESTFYARTYLHDFPALCLLFPFAVLYQLRTYRHFGLFLILSVVVPFAFHAFVFPMKQDRYAYHLFPFFAIALAPSVERLASFVLSRVRRDVAGPHRHALSVAQTAALALLAGALAYPWLKPPTDASQLAPWEDWKTFYLQTGRFLDPSAKMLTTNPLAFYHYFSRVADYDIRAEYDSTSKHYLTGATQVRTLEDLRAATEGASLSYLIVPSPRFSNDTYLTDEMRSYIDGHYAPIGLPYRSKIRLLRARPDERVAGGSEQTDFSPNPSANHQ
jgi:hypothetical protein